MKARCYATGAVAKAKSSPFDDETLAPGCEDWLIDDDALTAGLSRLLLFGSVQNEVDDLAAAAVELVYGPVID